MRSIATLFLVIACVAAEPLRSDDFCRNKTCEYNFNVFSKLVMGYGQNLAWADPGGRLFYHENNPHDKSDMTVYPVPDADLPGVLVLDGYERTVMSINGQLPGPTIEVYEGTEIVVHVTNNMENEGVTFHWHGMYQRGTPYMDGVSMITQCPIPPYTTFTYRFIAEPAGTHGYHSHQGIERPDGLFGALIVHPRPAPEREEKGQSEETVVRDVHAEMCDEDRFVMIMNDWYHESSDETMWKRLGPGFFPQGPHAQSYNWTRGPDHKLVGEVPFVAGLINGRGRSVDAHTGLDTNTNYTVYNVKSGGVRVCFRAIGAMMEKAFRVSVDGHLLTVIASDGATIEPVQVQSVIVHPGETYDFMVETRASRSAAGNGNFWVRAATLALNVTHEARAIVRYEDSPEQDPTTSPDNCAQAAKPCLVMNCPFALFPRAMNLDCIFIDQLRNADSADPAPAFPAAQSTEKFLNFAFAPLGVNRREFVFPTSPLLTQPLDAHTVPCDQHRCDFDACNCTHTLDAPFNTSLTMVFTNLGAHDYGMHPVHLHGHRYWVLKVGNPIADPVTGLIINSTRDITCVDGTDCGVAHWTNNTAPAFNYDRPIRKDTVVVPPGGYVVVRILIDNPGVWHMHCHMAHHLFYGLGMLINAAPSLHSHFPAPADFPKCGNYDPHSNPLTARAAWASLVRN